ncbi:hypothetical protein ACFY71_31690 [Streptomyces cinerochromogenes]|uniref:hypothetical protein n=1 Tax=Streptomyces cinerochromogenes TaxID=66422 RepID=UPI0036A9CCCC
MIEDARAAGFDLQKRTIHDWIRRGLLDQPLRRGAGRGSRPGLHSENQRKLFLLLLTKRDEMPKLPTLALIPLSIWLLWGHEWVPTRQARKALATWFGDGARRKQVCHEAALGVLKQLDHPLASATARARLVRLFEAISYRGRMTAADRGELEAAARAVFEPKSVFGSTGLVRAVGPSALPLTVEALLTNMTAVAEAIRVLRDDGMTEGLLEQAKTLYHRSKREYAEIRPALGAQTAGPLSALFLERTLDQEVNAIGTDLLLIIGLLLTSSRARVPASAVP